MTKDEYEEFALRYKGCGACFPMYHTLSRFEKMWFSAIQKDVAELEKENTELEEKISVLLSCKNCPENKGGWCCEKEYEGRCLSQKVMFIKELKQENAELEKQLTKAKELLRKFLDAKNIEERCVAESEADHFLSGDEE